MGVCGKAPSSLLYHKQYIKYCPHILSLISRILSSPGYAPTPTAFYYAPTCSSCFSSRSGV